MNLYEFSLDYLKDQTQTYASEVNVDTLEERYCEKCNLYAWAPYFTVEEGHETLNDIFKMFAMILQNYQALPKIVKFSKGNFDFIKQVTHNWDYRYISTIQLLDLLTAFDESCTVNDTAFAKWALYCMGLKQAAKLLVRYNSFNEFKSEAESNIDLFMKKIQKIPGIGETMAYNFVKEIGFDYGKPDVHLLDVFKVFYSDVTEENFDNYLSIEADKADVSKYKLDRIIWLICSGSYFMDDCDIVGHYGIKKGDLKERFIAALKAAMENHQVE